MGLLAGLKMQNTYPIPQRFLSQNILKYEFRFISYFQDQNKKYLKAPASLDEKWLEITISIHF